MSRVRLPSDRWLFGLTVCLVIGGLAILASATGPTGFEKFQDTFSFVRHQLLLGVLPGLTLLLIAWRLPARMWERLATPFFFCVLALLVLVLLPGVHASFGTAKSWIDLGPFAFQPAEVMKIAWILFLAKWFALREGERLADPREGLYPFLLWVGLLAVLLVLQPDLGTLSILVAIAGGMYLTAGAPWKHVTALVVGSVVLLLLLIRLAPYRAERFMTFLHPELDPQGVGYHINQALLAIGSGGFFGLGFGHSRQKFEYLPEVAGDSVFAVMAEELGWVLTAGVLALLFVWVRSVLRAGIGCNRFSQLVCTGVAIWIGTQVCVNVGAMLGLLPLTGVPLPFISYGGTAMVTQLFAFGIMLSLSRMRASGSR